MKTCCFVGPDPPPPGVPGIRKAVKKQVGGAYIRCEQNFCSPILHYFFTSSLCTVLCMLYRAMNTVAHFGPHLQCRSSTKSTSFIVAWTDVVGAAHCKAPLRLYIVPRGLMQVSLGGEVRSPREPADD